MERDTRRSGSRAALERDLAHRPGNRSQTLDESIVRSVAFDFGLKTEYLSLAKNMIQHGKAVIIEVFERD